MNSLLQRLRIQEDPNRPVPKEAYGWRVYAQALCAAGGASLVGYDHAYIGGTSTLSSFQHAFGIDPRNKAALLANIMSTMIAGCALGSVMGYILAEKLGRKKALLFASIVTSIGGMIQMFKGHIGLLYAGRIISGVAIGTVIGTIPVYISEIAPPTIRGRLAGMEMCVALLTQLLGYWINYAVERTISPKLDTQWRIPVAIQFVPPGILLLSLPFMIESPRWLVHQGRHQQALESLAWIRNLAQDHEYVQWELSEIQKSAASSLQGTFKQNTAASWKELRQPGTRRRLVLATTCKILHSINGMTLLSLYGPLLLVKVGFVKKSEALFFTGFYGVVKVVVTAIFTLFLIDSWGRRKTVLTGTVFVFVAQFYLGTFSGVSKSFEHTPPRDAALWLALVAIYVWTAAYAAAWAWFPSVFASEIFPTHLRAMALMCINVVGWIMHFVVAYSTPYMIEHLKWGTFIFFGCLGVLSTVVVFVWVPETSSIPLEKTGLLFEGSKWARKARKDAERKLEEEARKGSSSSTGSVELEGTETVVVGEKKDQRGDTV
ncbi:mfs quinate transporter [Lecanosticta acicola]|uniref:Mfs quinate transporter n=1 Tax=Lecanosticta acicola TaxID=111012 RepID=A0AAI9EC44_9PEZI|nr:mfs quinate transporter [Lecanosticta acicola]